MVAKRLQGLVRKHGGEVVPFEALPDAHAKALIYYMAVDGEAWELSPTLEALFVGQFLEDRRFRRPRAELKLQRALDQSLPWYRSAYEGVPVGIVDLPMKDLIREVMKDDAAEEFESFRHYHEWFTEGAGGIPVHRRVEPWPVILSDNDDETLQDGWHRLHRYYELGLKKVPAIYSVSIKDWVS